MGAATMARAALADRFSEELRVCLYGWADRWRWDLPGATAGAVAELYKTMLARGENCEVATTNYERGRRSARIARAGPVGLRSCEGTARGQDDERYGRLPVGAVTLVSSRDLDESVLGKMRTEDEGFLRDLERFLASAAESALKP
jgi:hypothetical protein